MYVPQIGEDDRDAVALVLCALRGDTAGASAILASTDPAVLVNTMASMVASWIGSFAFEEGCTNIAAAVDASLVAALRAQYA